MFTNLYAATWGEVGKAKEKGREAISILKIIKRELFKKLKQLEKLNGRIAMGGLVYLLFTKLVSSRTDILDQLKSIFI